MRLPDFAAPIEYSLIQYCSTVQGARRRETERDSVALRLRCQSAAAALLCCAVLCRSQSHSHSNLIPRVSSLLLCSALLPSPIGAIPIPFHSDCAASPSNPKITQHSIRSTVLLYSTSRRSILSSHLIAHSTNCCVTCYPNSFDTLGLHYTYIRVLLKSMILVVVCNALKSMYCSVV